MTQTQHSSRIPAIRSPDLVLANYVPVFAYFDNSVGLFARFC